MSFSSSLVFSSFHHSLEDHWNEEHCSAGDAGEIHLHGWEFEHCDVCDLQLVSNYLKSEFHQGTLLHVVSKPYTFTYGDALHSEHYFYFTNRGPPAA